MMSFFRKLFGSTKTFKECPRCLGKGHVDRDDIRRLNKELVWGPGKCAYCNGKGAVDSKIESNVPVDATYLTTDLDEAEREKIIRGNPDAIERGMQLEDRINAFHRTILHWHVKSGLTPLQITERFLENEIGSADYQEKFRELLEVVDLVIQKYGEER